MSKMLEETDKILKAHFERKDLDERDKGGVKLLYVPWHKAYDRADAGWGSNWSFIIERAWIEEGWTFVQGYVEDPNGNRRSAVDGQEIAKRRGSDKPVDIGDNFKGASVACAAKCLQQFGIGRYLSDRNRDKKKDIAPPTSPDDRNIAKLKAAEAYKAFYPNGNKDDMIMYMEQNAGRELKNITVEQFNDITKNLNALIESQMKNQGKERKEGA